MKSTSTIYDPLRKKEVAHTPEESVRQDLITWLNKEIGVSMNLMMSEYPFTYNSLNYRADIVVFDLFRQPLILVECKSPKVRITQDVIQQGIRYNRVLKVKYLIFSNGINTYALGLNIESSKYELLNRVPTYKEMLEKNRNKDE